MIKNLVALIATSLMGLTLIMTPVSASPTDPDCLPTTETVFHPAVTEDQTIPGVWANWAPNNTQGPQDYVPIWPADERGTWIVHDQGVPPGHEGPDGVYQQGQGNSPWFYRQAEQTVTVIVEEPWTETITHPAVKDCDSTEKPPVDEPKVPVVKPEPRVEDPRTPQTVQRRQPVEIPTSINSGL